MPWTILSFSSTVSPFMFSSAVLITLAGIPTAKQPLGTSLMTRDRAPTVASSPTVTPGIMKTPAGIQAPRFI